MLNESQKRISIVGLSEPTMVCKHHIPEAGWLPLLIFNKASVCDGGRGAGVGSFAVGRGVGVRCVHPRDLLRPRWSELWPHKRAGWSEGQ